MIGRLATLESSRVRWPSQPASTNPAVEWMRRPSRPREDLPSRRATRSVGQGHPLEGRAQDELAGVEDQGLALGDLDQLGQVLEVLLDVDHAHGVVAEQPEVAVHVEVDRRRLDAVLAEGVDDDPARLELLADGAI